MKNLSVKVDSLGYKKIEREIASFYNLGSVDSSGLPHKLREDECGDFMVKGSKGGGIFSIRIAKANDDGCWLFARYVESK